MRKKWEEKDLISAVKTSKSYRQVLMKLGLKQAGGNYYQIKKFISLNVINTDHFTGQAWNKGLKYVGIARVPIDKVLVKESNFQSYKLKKRLFNEGLKKPVCEICGWSVAASDGRIPVEINHINGDHRDNRIFNLQILCPNCHSLTENYRGKNKRKY